MIAFGIFSRSFIREYTRNKPAINLSNLSPAPGSHKRRKRVGRGIAAHGHLCGRGANGQNSRSGGGPGPSFIGGQTPFHLAIPKTGFSNPNSKHYTEINLDRLQHLIDTGRLDASLPITLKSFMDAGVTVSKDGLKILGGGRDFLRQPIEIHATRFTETAIEAIKAVGGRPVAVFHTPEAIRQIKAPARYARKNPEYAHLAFDPPTRLKDRLFYEDPKNAGYLAREIIEKHSEEFKLIYNC